MTIAQIKARGTKRYTSVECASIDISTKNQRRIAVFLIEENKNKLIEVQVVLRWSFLEQIAFDNETWQE